MGRPPAISAELLLTAYRQGIFPMADPDGAMSWYSPDPRGVIPLEEFHLPHGLKRTLAKGLAATKAVGCPRATSRAKLGPLKAPPRNAGAT